MGKTIDWGFPKGRVAKTLRSILAPGLSDHEVEAYVVCLVSHLLIEDRLNSLLYRWLSQDAPRMGGAEETSKAEDMLWKNIVKTDFAKKYCLVEPFLALHFPSEAAIPWKINDLRNELFHGRATGDATFGGKPLADEEAVEGLFLAAQSAVRHFRKFEELINHPHAVAERWRARLEELGEPLL